IGGLNLASSAGGSDTLVGRPGKLVYLRDPDIPTCRWRTQAAALSRPAVFHRLEDRGGIPVSRSRAVMAKQRKRVGWLVHLFRPTSPIGKKPRPTVRLHLEHLEDRWNPSGALSLSAPVSADLGSGAPGTTISAAIGPLSVTDDRALLSASWTVATSATDFTTGAGTPAETISATDVSYDPGSITTTGTITATGTPVTLSGTATPVVTGTDGVGDNTATWNPVISVAVPGTAVGGVYTGTLTQSVS